MKVQPDAAGGSSDVFVLVNPGSGKRDRPLTPEELAPDSNVGDQLRFHILSHDDDIATLVSRARLEGFRTIVAAGGDGTICAVASALVDSDLNLGVVPLGTFNFFARGFGLPEDPKEALEAARTGTPKPINIGEVNGRHFLNNASLGAYASVLRQREKTYRRWGRSRLAAYWSVVVAMLTVYRPLTLKVTVDGKVQRFRTPMAFVAASAYQLEQFDLDGADEVRNGRFALFVAPDCSRFALMWRALLVATRGMKRDRDFTMLAGRDILIETRQKHRLVARDGEKERMKGPYRFVMREGALKLVVPADGPAAA